MDLMAYIFMTLFCTETMLLTTTTATEVRPRRDRPSRKQPRCGGPRCTPKELVDKLLFNYVKSEPPQKDAPTEVKLGIYVNSFYSISEQTMEYSVNFYLRQAWTDPRLRFTPPSKEEHTLKIEEMVDKIWLPDTFFRNEKKASFHSVTVPNIMLTLNASGYLWYVAKISATLACPMRLQKYPLDTQTCPMMFESFGYTMDTMYFSWIPTPIDIDPSVELPQFTLEDTILYDCSQNYTGGAFPCLEIRFILRRDIGFFLIQVYIPSILIVILSWVSFWINVDAIPARVSLGLLTVLTMTTQSTAANQALPRVSYIKAIDVWMSMCLVFVFTALLEFAIVNVISRRGVRAINPLRKRASPSITRVNMDTPVDQINIMDNHTTPPSRSKAIPKTVKRVDPEGKSKAQKIDKLSRKIFPLSFMLFNLVYWILYTIPSGFIGP